MFPLVGAVASLALSALGVTGLVVSAQAPPTGDPYVTTVHSRPVPRLTSLAGLPVEGLFGVTLNREGFVKTDVAGVVVGPDGSGLANVAFTLSGSSCVIFEDGHGGFVRRFTGFTTADGSITAPGWRPGPGVDVRFVCPGVASLTLTVRGEESTIEVPVSDRAQVSLDGISLDSPVMRMGAGRVRLSGSTVAGGRVEVTKTFLTHGDAPLPVGAVQAGADGRWRLDVVVGESTEFVAHLVGHEQALSSLPAVAWVLGTPSTISASPVATQTPAGPTKPTLGQYAPSPGSVASSDGYALLSLGNIHGGAGKVTKIDITARTRHSRDQVAVNVPVDPAQPDHYWGIQVSHLTTGRAYAFVAHVCTSLNQCVESDPFTFTPYGRPEAGWLTAVYVTRKLSISWGPVVTHSSPYALTCRLSIRSADMNTVVDRKIGTGYGAYSIPRRTGQTYTVTKVCGNGYLTVATTAGKAST